MKNALSSSQLGDFVIGLQIVDGALREPDSTSCCFEQLDGLGRRALLRFRERYELRRFLLIAESFPDS